MTLVSMIDVLAILQPDVDADVVLVRFSGGASHALAIREIIRGDDYRMRLDRRRRRLDPGDAALERATGTERGGDVAPDGDVRRVRRWAVSGVDVNAQACAVGAEAGPSLAS